MVAGPPKFSRRIRRRIAIWTANRADGFDIGPEIGSLAAWLASTNDPRFIRGYGRRSAWRRKLCYGARLQCALCYARRHGMSTVELAAHLNRVGFPAINGRLHPVRRGKWTPELVAWVIYWCLPLEGLTAEERPVAAPNAQLPTGEFP